MKKKNLTLGEVGFAMKAEAHRTHGNTMVVSKELWIEIAELLMKTDGYLKQIEKTLRGTDDGKR
jgi:hypothetical protein